MHHDMGIFFMGRRSEKPSLFKFYTVAAHDEMDGLYALGYLFCF